MKNYIKPVVKAIDLDTSSQFCILVGSTLDNPNAESIRRRNTWNSSWGNPWGEE